MPIVLPSGFQITSTDPIDSRITVASQIERLGFSEYNVYNGLLVFQRDTNELYVLTDTGSHTSNTGWQLVGSGSGGTVDTGSLMTTASAVLNVVTFTKGDGSTFAVTVDTGSGGGSVPAGTVSSSAQITNLGFINETVTSSMSVASASIANIATYTSEWILGANGFSDYTFTGPGLTGAENDPLIYLTRGQQYEFTNNMNAHPFRIQSTPNGSTGTQYNDGITNNDVSNGTLLWNVQFDSPDILYYQCTAHPAMGGKIVIINSGSSASIPSGTVSSSAQITNLGFVQSSITASSLETASVNLNEITFTKGDGSTFAVTIDTGSGGGSVPAGTVSSSLQITNLGFINQTQTSSMTVATASYVAGANVDGQVASASIAETASYIEFNGNRVISNQYQPTGIRGENYGTNNLVDFIEQAYFANSNPIINSLVFDVNEYSAQGTTVGTISYTDPEGAVTFQTQSSYTDDDFRVASNGVITVQTTLLTESLENNNSQGYDAVLFPVRGTDGSGATVDKDLYIRIASNISPVFRENGLGGNVLPGAFTASLAESSAAGAKANGTVYVTDINGDTLTLQSGSLPTAFTNDFDLTILSDRFTLTQTTSSLDYDTNPTYDFVLTSSDEHYQSGQDPSAITYLNYHIRVLDNATPTINNQQFDINENVNVSNGQGLVSGEYRNVGQLSADGNDVGDIITYSNFVLQSLSIGGVNVPLNTYTGGGQSDPTENAFTMTSTGYITRINGVFVNSDLIDSYVYQVTVRDQYDPGNDTALITIDINDDIAPAINTNYGVRPYVIESALTNALAYVSSNGYSGIIATNSTTYNTQNETVSWTINSPGNLLGFNGTQQIQLAQDVSGSYVDGQTITFSVTASNTFGTENSQVYTLEVTENQAPGVSYSDVSGGLTGSQTPGTTVGTITVIDSQSENITNLELTGADAGSFVLGSNPPAGSSRTWDLNVGASNLAAGTYSLNGVGTDAYGKSTTQPISITISSAAATSKGYAYTMDLSGTVNNVLGISSTNSSTPPVPTISTVFGLLNNIINEDNLGDATITFDYGGTDNYSIVRGYEGQGTTPDDFIKDNDLANVSVGDQVRLLLFVPKNGNMTDLPTSFYFGAPNASNTTPNQYCIFINSTNTFSNGSDGGFSNIKGAKVFDITLNTAVDGYTDWYLIIAEDRYQSSTGNIYSRMIPADASDGGLPS